LRQVLEELFDIEQPSYDADDVYRYQYSDYQKAFVVILHNEKDIRLTRIPAKTAIKPDKLVFPEGAGGLLVNNQTLEIIDYVRIKYRHDTLVTTTMQRPLNLLYDTDPHRIGQPQLGYTRYQCPNEPWDLPFSMFAKELRGPDNFELVDLAFQE
jgi:hypothetical protein